MRGPQLVAMSTFRVSKGYEQGFLTLLQNWWPMMHRLGFVEDEPSVILRRIDPKGRTTFVETFIWKADGLEAALDHPEVLALLKQMAPMCTVRDGLPKWSFPTYTRLQ